MVARSRSVCVLPRHLHTQVARGGYGEQGRGYCRDAKHEHRSTLSRSRAFMGLSRVKREGSPTVAPAYCGCVPTLLPS
jgi:hypothetical protein